MRFIKIAAASAVISLLGMIPLTACSHTSGDEGTTDEEGNQPATDAPESVDPDACVATVYAENDFEGNQLCLPAGTFTRADLDARGFTEASIRSLTLHPGFRVRVGTDAPGGHYESASATNALTRLGLKAGSTRSVSVAPGYTLKLERADGTTTTTDVLDFENDALENPGRAVISAHVLAKPEPPLPEAPDADESIERTLSVDATDPGLIHPLAAANPDGKGNLKDFKHVYLLGDSLTDQGNAYKAIRGLWCPNPSYGYWEGRFTNGRNWVDYFQKNNNLKGLENRAVGGSKVLDTAIWRPSLMEQAQAAMKKTSKEDRKFTMVILWSGPNDITAKAQSLDYQGGTKPASSNGWRFGSAVGTGIVNVMNYLHKEGINHIVVADLPPLDLVPLVRTPPFTIDPRNHIGEDRVTFMKASVKSANFLIKLHAVVHKEVYVPMTEFITSYITGEVKNPAMSDVHDACQVLGGLNACTTSLRHPYIDKPCDKKMFMDQLHPTSLAHCFLKGVFEEAMRLGGYTGIEFGDCGPRN